MDIVKLLQYSFHQVLVLCLKILLEFHLWCILFALIESLFYTYTRFFFVMNLKIKSQFSWGHTGAKKQKSFNSLSCAFWQAILVLFTNKANLCFYTGFLKIISSLNSPMHSYHVQICFKPCRRWY